MSPTITTSLAKISTSVHSDEVCQHGRARRAHRGFTFARSNVLLKCHLILFSDIFHQHVCHVHVSIFGSNMVPTPRMCRGKMRTRDLLKLRVKLLLMLFGSVVLWAPIAVADKRVLSPSNFCQTHVISFDSTKRSCAWAYVIPHRFPHQKQGYSVVKLSAPRHI